MIFRPGGFAARRGFFLSRCTKTQSKHVDMPPQKRQRLECLQRADKGFGLFELPRHTDWVRVRIERELPNVQRFVFFLFVVVLFGAGKVDFTLRCFILAFSKHPPD